MKVLEGRGQESNHSRSKQHQVWLKAPAEFSAESLGLLEHCAPARGQLTDYGMVDFSQGTCPRLNFFDGDLLLLLFVLLIYFLSRSWREVPPKDGERLCAATELFPLWKSRIYVFRRYTGTARSGAFGAYFGNFLLAFFC